MGYIHVGHIKLEKTWASHSHLWPQPGGQTLMHAQRIAWSHYEGPAEFSKLQEVGIFLQFQRCHFCCCYSSKPGRNPKLFVIFGVYSLKWNQRKKDTKKKIRKIVRMLEIIGEDTSSALHLAVHGGFQEVVEALLEARVGNRDMRLRAAVMLGDMAPCRRRRLGQTWTKSAQMDALRPMPLLRVSWRKMAISWSSASPKKYWTRFHLKGGGGVATFDGMTSTDIIYGVYFVYLGGAIFSTSSNIRKKVDSPTCSGSPASSFRCQVVTWRSWSSFSLQKQTWKSPTQLVRNWDSIGPKLRFNWSKTENSIGPKLRIRYFLRLLFRGS